MLRSMRPNSSCTRTVIAAPLKVKVWGVPFTGQRCWALGSRMAAIARTIAASRSISAFAAVNAWFSVRQEVMARACVAAARSASIKTTQSTDTSAQPRSARHPSRPSMLGFKQRLDRRKFMAKFVGDRLRLRAVVHDMGGDEHHQFGAGLVVLGVGKQIAEERDILEKRNTAFCDAFVVHDEAAQCHRLAILDCDRARDLALLDGRGIERRTCRAGDLTDLLRDVHHHDAAAIDARGHLQNDAG